MPETFGSLVRKARKARGLTQAEAGALVGVQHPAISKVEAGESCSVSLFRALVRALEIDPAEAIDAPISPSPETPTEEATTSV